MFDPFGMMGQPMGMPALTHGTAHHPRSGMHQMMPFGFPQMPNMQQMFADLVSWKKPKTLKKLF